MSTLHCPATLVVARHAHAEYVEDWFSDEGGSLSVDGRAQAEALAASLADRKIAHVWTSDTSRAVQTAEIAAAALGTGVTVTPRLREVFIGDLLGRPFDLAALTAVTDRWFAGDLDSGFPGGEDGTRLITRYAEALGRIADQHPGETVLVVSHQLGTGIALPSLATGTSPSYAGANLLGNGASAELQVDAEGWRITRWG